MHDGLGFGLGLEPQDIAPNVKPHAAPAAHHWRREDHCMTQRTNGSARCSPQEVSRYLNAHWDSLFFRRGVADEANFTETFLEVSPRGDWGFIWLFTSGHALGQRGQTHVRHRVAEERHAETRLAPKRFGWVDDTVGRRLELLVGEPLKHVAHVDHQLVGQCSHWGPVSDGVHHFQARCRSTHQQGDEVDVLMLACPDAGLGLLQDGGSDQRKMLLPPGTKASK